MSDKFEAFKAALEALCKEHNVRLRGDWLDSDYYKVLLEEASEEAPAGLDLDIEDVPPLTPEEKAAAAARKAEWEAAAAKREAEYHARMAAQRAAYEKDLAQRLQSPEYLKRRAIVDAYAAEQRKKNMRVTRIPGDRFDIGDRPCRVFCNEIEIKDWTVADDFRRVVETPGGVHHGAVRIDLAPLPEAAPEVEPEPEAEPAPVAKAKPNIHIPARKLKAGK